MSNTTLHKAKQVKNDEFYTRYEDIEAELSHYPIEYFKDKVIYCPCDVGVNELRVPKSNFIKYFENNKERLGYKKLIHTSLQEGFDYRSDYCQKLFKEADVVVTNPPFSLFRDFVTMLEKYQLKYCIVGNMNALTYKEIFPLIKANKLWWGASLRGTKCSFIVPDDYNASNLVIENGIRKAKINNAIWFTNMDIAKRHENLLLVKQYNEKDYPKYDNYDAVNVDKLKDIPYDYDGVMGVPITFLYQYNPDQFEIVNGIGRYACIEADYTNPVGTYGTDINGQHTYFRVLICRKK